MTPLRLYARNRADRGAPSSLALHPIAAVADAIVGPLTSPSHADTVTTPAPHQRSR